MKIDAVSVLLTFVCLTTTTHALLPQQNASLPELYERASGGGGKTSGGSRTGSGSRGSNGKTTPELPKSPTLAKGLKSTPQDADRFSLGEYDFDSPKQLFRTFEEPADINFFAQVFTFFAAQPDAELSSNDKTYADEKGSAENPFNPSSQVYKDNKLPLTGQPLRFTRVFSDDSASAGDSATTSTISTFHPRQSTAVCGAWASLAGYCASGGTDCACYSGTYYVPEMWNSLAAGCASFFDPNTACDPDNYWCALGRTASKYTDWCETESPEGTPTARFAQHANRATATATASAADESDDDDDDDDGEEETGRPAAAPQAASTTAPRTTAATSTHTTTTTSSSLTSRTTSSSSSVTLAAPTSSVSPMTGSASASRAWKGQCWWLLSVTLPLLYITT